MNLIAKVYNNEELRKKILFLMVCLMIYKIGMHITVPWVNVELLETIGRGEGLLSLVNSLNGGALANFSIFAVGIIPYITASIVINLLQMDVIPSLTEWKRQGEAGRKKTKKLTYTASIFVALVQSIAMSFGFNKMYPGLVENESIPVYLIIALTLTLGTIILLIMAEYIDRKGIGKGISMIIFAGILMSLPNNLAMYYELEFTGVGDTLFISIIKTILLVIFAYSLLIAVIIVNGGERRVPIQHTSERKSHKNNFLPFKLNSAGVIPVIFASAIIMTPMTIVEIFGVNKFTTFVNNYINYTSITGMILFFLIIIGMTYLYTFIQMNPKTLADDLKNNESHVPSIKPGKDTEIYFKNLLVRLTLVGSVFLAVISIAPMVLGIITSLPQQLTLGGTSIIIIVSVVVDLKSQVSSALKTGDYKKQITLSGKKMFDK